MRSRWPSWRFQPTESVEQEARIAEAKTEAEEALKTSREQLAEVHSIVEAHKPIRDRLQSLREQNKFAEGFRRVIEEGR